ncbi:DUF4405 domain-containing protein [Candidatus Marinarcus aquaticus]|uniref:Flavinylation-associated cytochrome domain-containing protein n=1 Tax=Candidatus Marinarcus aquaticus TaxID=2044504 RepID=A0A4Q0XXY9_9BACT|nr:DUF4405 domain-containing protein [Candidatus Marinarcus aquaticus]RXJ60811.1 hypothetical protein CRV04_02010 [Candidatus Marinarcus aquaticus]
MKKFISLLMLWCMLMMTYTGVMLFIAPEGRVAYWSNWSMFGLDKEQFGDLHVTFMVLFVFTTVFHIAYNIKPMFSYMKNKYKEFIFFSKPNIVALAITACFLIGTLFVSVPFSYVLQLEKNVKHYWADTLGRPPYGHAELSSLRQFSKRMGYDVKEVIQVFKEKGIVIDTPNTNLKEIAQKNSTTPAKLYDILFEALEM